MSRGIRRPTPALVVALIALFVALGGGVYAATGIDGHTIRPKTLPGNRLVPGTVAANRLKAGSIPGSRLAPQSVTGAQVDATTLGQVPSASRADRADSAREAGKALFATSAGDAASVDGHVAACPASSRQFAGACWQNVFSDTAATAPEAAADCAEQGGELPAALALIAFSEEQGISLPAEGEWTQDIAVWGSKDNYDVATVVPGQEIDAAFFSFSRKYRCVFPLLS
jgi:hypothetical protein